MSRNRTQRKPSLTAIPPQLDRQARRINRQQKHIDRELVQQMGQTFPAVLTGAKGRGIKISDLKKISPLTEKQTDFFHAYEDGEESLVLYGSAGVGKSFLALYHALRDVLEYDSTYDKIIIVRSCVQSRGMGFTPGSEVEKMMPYELPYHSICADLLGRSDAYDKLKEMSKIEFLSTSFLRGSTFNNSIIIFDEAQNATFAEISTVLTRVGKNSKVIVMGDSKQDDLVFNKNDMSGFRSFIEVARNMQEFQMFKFTTDDIVRSGFVKSWLVECERLGL